MTITPSINDDEARERHMTEKIKRHAQNYGGSRLVEFSVQMALPPGAGHADARYYVNEALRMHAGSLEAGEDPMADIDRTMITVLTIEPPVERERYVQAVVQHTVNRERTCWTIALSIAIPVMFFAGVGAGVWFVLHKGW